MVICWNTGSTTGNASWEPECNQDRKEGEGEEEHLQGRSRRAVSLEMRKKIDSEVVKMMQLQNQTVSHKAIYTEGQIHAFHFLSWRIKKIKRSGIPSLSTPPLFWVLIEKY